MNENDIALDLSMLPPCGSKIVKHVNELERFASLLKHNMAVAKNNFDSVNYVRASETVDSVIAKIRELCRRMDNARTFLNKIEDSAENYLRCKYGG